MLSLYLLAIAAVVNGVDIGTYSPGNVINNNQYGIGASGNLTKPVSGLTFYYTGAVLLVYNDAVLGARQISLDSSSIIFAEP